MVTAEQELAMGDALHRQGSTSPNGRQDGKVLVAALIVHKDGPPPRGRPDTRIRYMPGQQYWLDPERAERAERAGTVCRVGVRVLDWFGGKGRVLSPWPDDQETVFTREPMAGSLRIIQGCGYDPGSQAYRFHSALAMTKHASAFVRWGDSNPHCSLRQFDGERDAPLVRQGILDADVVHCHVNYMLLNNSGLGRQPGQLLIRHYHGSVQNASRSHVEVEIDEARGALLVGARLSFFRDAEMLSKKLRRQIVIQWLPITVPVQRYRELPMRTPDGEFWIAHAPTRRAYKGTEKFITAVRRLRAKGLPVRPVLIEGKSQADALQMKRQCDATFDSFWLGIQTSGLEGAAMGQPVIAGDPDVRDLHQQHVGYCPYTYANTEAELTTAIERLVVDADYRQAEATRVSDYCLRYHDYPAVARRYEQILSQRLGRTDIFTGATS